MNGFGFVWVWFKQIFFFQILNFIFCHVIIPKLIFLFLKIFFCTNQTLKITFKNIITKHLWKYFQTNSALIICLFFSVPNEVFSTFTFLFVSLPIPLPLLLSSNKIETLHRCTALKSEKVCDVALALYLFWLVVSFVDSWVLCFISSYESLTNVTAACLACIYHRLFNREVKSFSFNETSIFSPTKYCILLLWFVKHCYGVDEIRIVLQDVALLEYVPAYKSRVSGWA